MRMSFLILCTLIASASAAHGYVYPPDFVYKNLLETTKDIQSVSFEKHWYELGEDNKITNKKLIQEVYIKRPGHIRVKDQTRGMEKKINPNRAVMIKNDQAREVSLKDALTPMELFLLFDQSDALTLRMGQFFTPVHQYQWFLFQGKKHWMQGQKQETFFLISTDPYRLRMAKHKDVIYQYEYKAGQTLPFKIILFKDDTPKAEIKIENLKINPSIPQAYFQTP